MWGYLPAFGYLVCVCVRVPCVLCFFLLCQAGLLYTGPPLVSKASEQLDLISLLKVPSRPVLNAGWISSLHLGVVLSTCVCSGLNY